MKIPTTRPLIETSQRQITAMNHKFGFLLSGHWPGCAGFLWAKTSRLLLETCADVTSHSIVAV